MLGECIPCGRRQNISRFLVGKYEEYLLPTNIQRIEYFSGGVIYKTDKSRTVVLVLHITRMRHWLACYCLSFRIESLNPLCKVRHLGCYDGHLFTLLEIPAYALYSTPPWWLSKPCFFPVTLIFLGSNADIKLKCSVNLILRNWAISFC